MILFEILGTEQHATYQDLEIANGARQYDFLRSLVTTSLAVSKPFLSSQILQALNFQAIACLHTNAGEYRPCEVVVGKHTPPAQHRVSALMDDFINTVNRQWESVDAVLLAAFVLWRLNYIHPFINGNGRTARAASYFVLCVKANAWLPGTVILPELLRRERVKYVEALVHADSSLLSGALDLAPLHALMVELLAEQLAPYSQGVPQASPPAQSL
jgi:fido (protein-threonine AMPylation protein)